MPIKYTTVKIPTATPNGDGDATSTSLHTIRGKIMAVYVKYASESAAGTDVEIKTSGNVGGENSILTLTDTNTSGWYYPRHQVHGSDGTALTYDGSNPVVEAPVINDLVQVVVAQATESKTVDVTLLMETY